MRPSWEVNIVESTNAGRLLCNLRRLAPESHAARQMTCPQAVFAAFLAIVCCWNGGCGSTAAGKMEWIQPQTKAPRAGSVYLIRGWVGLFSSGIDDLAAKLTDQGVTARVFQHSQCQELASSMAEHYKAVHQAEPICLIGHSFGSDDALIIAGELDKIGVPVQLIVTLDPVDQTTVPKNVEFCYNYWMPGVFGNSNFLRGIPLKQAPGSAGRLVNVNLNEEGRDLKDPLLNHINIDEGHRLQQRIIDHVLEVCPQRSAWLAMHPNVHKAGSQLRDSTHESADESKRIVAPARATVKPAPPLP